MKTMREKYYDEEEIEEDDLQEEEYLEACEDLADEVICRIRERLEEEYDDITYEDYRYFMTTVIMGACNDLDCGPDGLSAEAIADYYYNLESEGLEYRRKKRAETEQAVAEAVMS